MAAGYSGCIPNPGHMTAPILNRERQGPTILLATAIAVAALGTWIMYAAKPGLNWGVWTTVAAVSLVAFVRRHDRLPVIAACLTAAIIAFGATVTADPFLYGLICLAVILFLAIAMLLSIDPRIERITPRFAIPAPIFAFAFALAESARRATRALHVVRSSRARSVLRGIAITLPIVVVFALLLSSADPLFAELRDTLDRILSTWEFLPRTVFFLAMLAIVLGAYGFADREEPPPPQFETASTPPSRWLGSTERVILQSSVAALFWIFIAIQVTYLFGTSPRVTGSGMTFAEYARRGFAELTIVASASVFLILFCERFGEPAERRGLLRSVTLALIAGILFLLASAFHRVSLYEQAYGFTTSRLYAQAYMIVVAVALIALVVEVQGEIQPSRLFRRTGAAATMAFIVLIYWNHEAWIANRNIDRLPTAGRLDTVYLTRDLSANAVPTLVERLRTLPEPMRSELSNALAYRYTGRRSLRDDRWFEWNAGRSAAVRALSSIGISVDYKRPATPGSASPLPPSRTRPRTQP